MLNDSDEKRELRGRSRRRRQRAASEEKKGVEKLKIEPIDDEQEADKEWLSSHGKVDGTHAQVQPPGQGELMASYLHLHYRVDD